MKITTKAWTEYIDKLAEISDAAADKMQKWIQKNGFADTDALIEYAVALSDQYGEAAGALACEMYERIAEAQGVIIQAAEIADNPTYGEVAKAVLGTLKQSETLVPATVGRMTKQTSADTMLKNAKRDGAYFAWIPHGNTCPYCLMMAAVGWQKAGKKTLKGNHAEHIHSHCKCQYVVDFKGNMQVEGYNPENLKKDLLKRADPDEEHYGGNFDMFLNNNGRTSGKRNNADLNAIRRSFNE